MALTEGERDALNRLDLWPGGVVFDPTIARSCVEPLADLLRASPADVLDYGRQRGWSDEVAGRVVGAIELFRTLTFTGALAQRPYEDE